MKSFLRYEFITFKTSFKKFESLGFDSDKLFAISSIILVILTIVYTATL